MTRDPGHPSRSPSARARLGDGRCLPSAELKITRAEGDESLFLRACRRKSVERTPIWIMRQAGRYLPEYREIRAKADFLTSCRTPEIACELTLQPVRRLGVDAAILFSDILIPLPGMGVSVEFDPAPRLASPIRTSAAIEALRVPDPREATPFVMDAVRLVRRELPGSVPLIGFAGAPFTMATYLVEGGGSKSFTAMKSLLFAEPGLAHSLLAKCADTIAPYLSEQVRAGAQAAMLFDTWAGILSPADYGMFALPYARRVFDAVGDPGVPRIYYAGESAGYLEMVREVGAEVIGCDWRLDLDAARRRLGSGLALQGNLDPAVLLGPHTFIEQRARDVLRRARDGAESRSHSMGSDAGLGQNSDNPSQSHDDPSQSHGDKVVGTSRGHIFNLGHGILPETRPENAQFLVETVHRLSAAGPRSSTGT